MKAQDCAIARTPSEARQHKEVQLLTEGGQTELDRNLVEELADPLPHMIRNAVDHGIETVAARAANN
jgi:two-component system, chemotaxis family, sensor kinase CheA